MKIVVTGTRGIPDIQGGVETHCEKLYPLLVSLGCDVIVIRRSCYVNSSNKKYEYKGVKLKDIYAPRKKSLEAIVHTFLAIIYAKRKSADLIHIHAIGPSILVPFARLLGLKVVVTHHGPDYDRHKWGKIAKAMLKLGEKNAARYANQIISISDVISNILKDKYKREKNVNLVFNGVDKPRITDNDNYIESLGLEKGRYIFTLGRFVEEKGFHNLIEAYSKCRCNTSFKLVIAGDADHETEYSIRLKKLAGKHGVILTGFIKGAPLSELFSHAALFILPSFHEGLPIALLEAMSYRLDVLISDIPANRMVLSDEKLFFNPANVEELSLKLEEKLSSPIKKVNYDLELYDWNNIADQTKKIYEQLLTAKC